MHFPVLIFSYNPVEEFDLFDANIPPNPHEYDYLEFSAEFTYDQATKIYKEYCDEYWTDILMHPISLDDYMYEYHGYIQEIGENDSPNNFGYYYNPRGLYDWFVAGGRWRDVLYEKGKTDSKYEEIPLKNLDLETIRLTHNIELKNKENYSIGDILGRLVECVVIDGNLYCHNDYEDITHWCSGITKLISDLNDPEVPVTIMDCHI